MADSFTITPATCREFARAWGPDPDNVARGIVQAFNIAFDFPTCISVDYYRDLGDLTLRAITLSPDCPEPCD